MEILNNNLIILKQANVDLLSHNESLQQRLSDALDTIDKLRNREDEVSVYY